MAKKIIALENNSRQVSEFGWSDHYDLGTLGTISKHRLSKEWYRLASPVVNNSMPWLAKFLDDTSELKPDDGAISFLIGNAGGHVDIPENKSAVNYIFYNTDNTSYTWVTDNIIRETYPSQANTAWILDSHKLHGIVNNGERWTLSIHFHEEYQKIKEWFDQHPNLTYSNITRQNT